MTQKSDDHQNSSGNRNQDSEEFVDKGQAWVKDLVHKLFISEILPVVESMIAFIRHPVEGIKQVPVWNWKKILVAQGIVTIGSGFLRSLFRLWESNHIGGIFGGLLYSVIMGFIVAPIISITLITVTSFVFYYAFLISTGSKPHFKTLHTVVFFSLIPFFMLNTVEDAFPFLKLLGLAFATPLMIVGFVENLKLNRNFVTKLVLIAFAALSIYIIINMIRDADWDFQSRDDMKAPEVQLGK